MFDTVVNSNSDIPNTSKKFSFLTSKHNVLLGIIIALILGTFVGGWFPNFALNFSIFGEIFMNLLMMIVVPLIVISMMDAVTKIGDIKNLGSLGGTTLIYFLVTTMMAVLIGIVVVNIIRPGAALTPGERHSNYEYTLTGKYNRTVNLGEKYWTKSHYNDKYVVIILDQLVQGQIESFSSNTVKVKVWERIDVEDQHYLMTTDGTPLQFNRINGQLISEEPKLTNNGKGVEICLPISKKVLEKSKGDIGKTIKEIFIGDRATNKQGFIPFNIISAMANMEVLSLIFFSLFLGAGLSALGKKAEVAIQIISNFNDALMKLVSWIMLFAPIGIFGLIAARIGRAGGFENFLPELFSLGKYGLTVLIGLMIHAFIVIPLIFKMFLKLKLKPFTKAVAPALLNAFSTASSNATLPISIRCMEEEIGASERTSRFVLTLAATINMNGTALYEAIAAIFIAQAYGIHLDPAMQAVVFLTATLAAIGAAGIPEAGLVTMVIVLKAVDLPLEGIGLLLSIDWLLDRFRTTVNVWSDCVGVSVIEEIESRKIRKAKTKLNPGVV